MESEINSEGRIGEKINRRIQNSSKLYHIIKGILWNTEIPQNTKQTNVLNQY
jgi:hypothetical protein